MPTRVFLGCSGGKMDEDIDLCIEGMILHACDDGGRGRTNERGVCVQWCGRPRHTQQGSSSKTRRKKRGQRSARWPCVCWMGVCFFLLARRLSVISRALLGPGLLFSAAVIIGLSSLFTFLPKTRFTRFAACLSDHACFNSAYCPSVLYGLVVRGHVD